MAAKTTRRNRSVYLTDEEWQYCKDQEMLSAPGRYIIALIQRDMHEKKHEKKTKKVLASTENITPESSQTDNTLKGKDALKALTELM